MKTEVIKTGEEAEAFQDWTSCEMYGHARGDSNTCVDCGEDMKGDDEDSP